MRQVFSATDRKANNYSAGFCNLWQKKHNKAIDLNTNSIDL